jgi:hypothetical protein
MLADVVRENHLRRVPFRGGGYPASDQLWGSGSCEPLRSPLSRLSTRPLPITPGLASQVVSDRAARVAGTDRESRTAHAGL